jgi:NifB/MoaA-like Fe-S oxidoreductase
MPAGETYEDYPQWENGVGLVRSVLDEAEVFDLPEAVANTEPILLAGGTAAMKALEPLWERLRKIRGFTVKLLPLENRFFGPSVTVSGLLTGKCIIEGLKSYDLPSGIALYLPDVMLRDRKEQFIDGMTVSEVSGCLGRELIFLPRDGYELLAKLMENRI